MPRLVMKFGGTSVADLERIRNAAAKVKREVDAGYDVAVIVSAMSGETNKMVDYVRDAAGGGERRGLERQQHLRQRQHCHPQHQPPR